MNLRAVSLALVLVSLPAMAQQPATAPTAPAAAPAPVAVLIDGATAKKLIAAVIAAAPQYNAKVCAAVVDANGDLIAFERMDGAAAAAVPAAQGKARTAAVFGVPSFKVQEAISSGQPLNSKINVIHAGAFDMMAVRGAVPVVKDGKVVAALGVGGSSSGNDEKMAQAAVDSLGK